MKNILLLCMLAGTIAACNSRTENPEYTLKTYSGDIKVEYFDSTITDGNRYNYNNRVYTVGSEFTYEYQYVSRDGRIRNFEFMEEGWRFTEPKEGDQNEITLRVRQGLKPMSDWIPDYNQTLINYQPANKDSYEMTGLIENEANIWLHPPREGLFQILQLSPYPTVSYPLKEGKEWGWDFRVGNSYADNRWATWEGVINIDSRYQVSEREDKDTHWGLLETWTIVGEAKSEIGTSYLTAVYNDSLGFLEMEFTNIDSSRFSFTLIDVMK